MSSTFEAQPQVRKHQDISIPNWPCTPVVETSLLDGHHPFANEHVASETRREDDKDAADGEEGSELAMPPLETFDFYV